jgi:hypothetical protein
MGDGQQEVGKGDGGEVEEVEDVSVGVAAVAV